jgi:hypothetical protein
MQHEILDLDIAESIDGVCPASYQPVVPPVAG